MAKYALEMNDTAGTTVVIGAIRVDATTPRRIKVYDVLVGSEAAPADNAFLWRIRRITSTGGTSSAVTPDPLDPADAAALADGSENYTVNPTVANLLLPIPLNQRASFRWVAVPGGELVAPATAQNGICATTPTSSAVAVTAAFMFEEQ